MRGKASPKNRIMRFIALPMRFLTRTRDCYVKGMTNCVVNAPKPRIWGSYSTVSTCSSKDNSEDFRELLRAASCSRKETNVLVQPQMRLRKVPRSCSVAMGRIDEEKPCFFEKEDNNIYVINPQLHYYPRSKSYAVAKKNLGF